jgi:hypothetical protein
VLQTFKEKYEYSGIRAFNSKKRSTNLDPETQTIQNSATPKGKRLLLPWYSNA